MTGKDRVPPTLAHSLRARGFTTLTPVQMAILDLPAPIGDLLISAPTGSGKTVALGLALARHILGPEGLCAPGQGPRALILAPTRELATQIAGELDWLYAGTGAWIGRCLGGADMARERAALEAGLDIIIGTPGRICDHLGRGALAGGAIGSVVLDEADDMLDLGFRAELDAILAALPETRQTLMVSATITPRIAALAAGIQRAARRVDIAASDTAITFQAMLAAAPDRDKAVVNALRLHEPASALVFCGRRATVSHLAGYLGQRGFRVVALSGDLDQCDRDAALCAMRAGMARVCVATDVAARGIDLPGLDLVIHADLPPNPESLLHRSGRTGRAGRKGLAILIVPPGLRRRAEALMARAGLAPEWQAAPGPAEIARADQARLLADPLLGPAAPPAAPEAVAALTAAHAPERIAAGFLHLWTAARPAAEALAVLATGLPSRRPPGGIWFRLDIGRRSDSAAGPAADVRALLPLICRLGSVARRDIGRVRVLETETHFEIRRSAARAFAAAIQHPAPRGPRVTRLDPSAPETS